MALTPSPTTAASSVHPVSVAIACPAASVSQETRLSLPSRCSATTRMVSGIYLREKLGRISQSLLGKGAPLYPPNYQQGQTNGALQQRPVRVQVRAALDAAIYERKKNQVGPEQQLANGHKNPALSLIPAELNFFHANHLLARHRSSSCSQHTNFVAQLVYQFLCDFPRAAFKVLGLLGFLRNIHP